MWGWGAEGRLSLGKVLRNDHSYSLHFKGRASFFVCPCLCAVSQAPPLVGCSLFTIFWLSTIHVCMCASVPVEAKVLSWVLFPRYHPCLFFLFETGSLNSLEPYWVALLAEQWVYWDSPVFAFRFAIAGLKHKAPYLVVSVCLFLIWGPGIKWRFECLQSKRFTNGMTLLTPVQKVSALYLNEEQIHQSASIS